MTSWLQGITTNVSIRSITKKTCIQCVYNYIYMEHPPLIDRFVRKQRVFAGLQRIRLFIPVECD